MDQTEFLRIASEKGPRYRVLARSKSGNTAFVATVIDTHVTQKLRRGLTYVSVCECDDADKAQVISAVMNKAFGHGAVSPRTRKRSAGHDMTEQRTGDTSCMLAPTCQNRRRKTTATKVESAQRHCNLHIVAGTATQQRRVAACASNSPG